MDSAVAENRMKRRRKSHDKVIQSWPVKANASMPSVAVPGTTNMLRVSIGMAGAGILSDCSCGKLKFGTLKKISSGRSHRMTTGVGRARG
eukprot:scaffold119678_cov33-Tisochrysis_lutea.AAC.3